MQDQLVFVYGTLRRGESNNRCFGDSEYMFEAVTEGQYVISGNGIPFVCLPSEGNSHAGRIVGDVYRVTKQAVMDRLDALEGHPNCYERKLIPLNGGLTAWMYHHDAGNSRSLPPNEDGDHIFPKNRRG